jgi:hypothetical protein
MTWLRNTSFTRPLHADPVAAIRYRFDRAEESGSGALAKTLAAHKSRKTIRTLDMGDPSQPASPVGRCGLTLSNPR